MKRRKEQVIALSIAALGAVIPSAVLAHSATTGAGEPVLHVANAYESCYFDLHSDLTQDEFTQFAGEAGTVVRFHQVSSAETLGKWNFDLGVSLSHTTIEDADGAWNNTMSHPEDDHWLGDGKPIPRVVFRMGVLENVDVGVWGSVDPRANYGFVGVESKIGVMQQSEGAPFSVAVRPNFTTMLGPSELWFGTGGVDASISYNFFGLSPYIGLGGMASIAVELTDEVDLSSGKDLSPVAFAGLEYSWKALGAGAEVQMSEMPSYAFRLSARF